MQQQRFFLAAFIVIGFFSVLYYMLYAESRLAEAMVGALIAAFPMSLKWYFDSSAGSERKTELLAKTGPIIEGDNSESVTTGK